MARMQSDRGEGRNYQLRFPTLLEKGRACAFPCDAIGQVNIDELGDRARNEYLYARAMIGFEFSLPVVQSCTTS